MKISKIALTSIIAGALAAGTWGLTHSDQVNPGWTSERICLNEKDLNVPHTQVREAEKYSGKGYGSMAPVYSIKDQNQNTRIDFEFVDGDGQAVAHYSPDGKMQKAVYFDSKGKRITMKYDNNMGRLVYCPRDNSSLDEAR